MLGEETVDGVVISATRASSGCSRLGRDDTGDDDGEAGRPGSISP